ncbi:hypothetical protein [Actinomadura miaoliensis]|uniref:Minor tail protein n=1 Tax=Actinomadura miaoliensis TaxID=430685 RepID=A0ABP7WX88_9ACTN
MTLHTPLWMQVASGDTPVQYSAQDDRLLLTSLWQTEGVTAGGLQVSQRAAGANFSVDIAPGQAVITGDDMAGQGSYLVRSDAVENLPIPAPPASGSRTHRVVAQVRDKLYNGTWTGYDWALMVLEDTGSGTPPVPGSAYSLATVTVTAGDASVTNANILDTRFNALSQPGRARLTGSDAERPAVPLPFEEIARTDKGCTEIFIDGAWREVPRRDGGGSAWTSYTPALTATTTNPSLGVGSTRSGRYIREGRRVTVQVVCRFGSSGINVGSGFYEIALPVAARVTSPGRVTGTGYCYDDSGADYRDGGCFINTGVSDKVRISIDSVVVRNNAPFTWASNDEFGFTLVYEAAS